MDRTTKTKHPFTVASFLVLKRGSAFQFVGRVKSTDKESRSLKLTNLPGGSVRFTLTRIRFFRGNWRGYVSSGSYTIGKATDKEVHEYLCKNYQARVLEYVFDKKEDDALKDRIKGIIAHIKHCKTASYEKRFTKKK